MQNYHLHLSWKYYDNLLPHELANLLPMIEGIKFAELKEDIRKNGILEPIKLFEDRILDGRNRHKAGKEVGYRLRRLA